MLAFDMHREINNKNLQIVVALMPKMKCLHACLFDVLFHGSDI